MRKATWYWRAWWWCGCNLGFYRISWWRQGVDAFPDDVFAIYLVIASLLAIAVWVLVG